MGLAVERPFPVFAQGPQPDGFFRLVVFLVPVVPSASLGDADMGPSGGLVGDASEARRLHERFDQPGRDVIARGPVRNQLSAHAGLKWTPLLGPLSAVVKHIPSDSLRDKIWH